jgi:hypothetical protein
VTGSEQSDITWHKSTASGTGSCVEVAVVDGSILVRNSRYPLGSVLTFTCDEWAAFLEGVNNGELAFDQITKHTL